MKFPKKIEQSRKFRLSGLLLYFGLTKAAPILDGGSSNITINFAIG